MANAQMADIELVEGNDHLARITLYDGQAPMTLSGATIQFMVKDVDANTKVVAADSAALITKTVGSGGVVVVDAAAGIIDVILLPNDTRGKGRPNLPYKFDVKVRTAAGKQYSTDYANFTIKDSVGFDDV